MSESPVSATYTDAFDRERRVDADVIAAVEAAMHLDEEAVDVDPVVVARPGSELASPGVIVLEDGTELGRLERVPREAPSGYHRLVRDDGLEQLLLTGPGRCHVPDNLREWGWVIQLAATRSARSWGIGDLGDLGDLASWAAHRGARFVAVGPLGAPNPGPEPEPSPYYPSSRRYGNPLHLRIEEIPGSAAVADLAERARRLNEERLVDRRRVLELKREALDRIWSGGAVDRDRFDAWRHERGESLHRWAAFCVLSERFGPGWQSWPAEYRDPAGAAVRRVAAEEDQSCRFHAWVQWCFDEQLARASSSVRRIADMPVGVDPGGFDAWDWQAQLAGEASVGAPPDRFNTAGQDWGLPPFVPRRLREARYRPFIETIRAQLRHAGGLRVDHVLGLFRLWWIPRGDDPRRGAYVAYPTAELLEILTIESERAGAVVIGEDLGTVPPGVRRELRRRRILSTRLALFEADRPSGYPRASLASVTTHDLPTVAGIWSGADLRDQASAGIEGDAKEVERLRRRLARAGAVPPDASAAETVIGLHAALAASPAMLVGATLEDALLVEERPNLPGTVGEQRANWSLALPATIEELATDDRVLALVNALDRGGAAAER